jgi:glutamate--LysW ligase ArgX
LPVVGVAVDIARVEEKLIVEELRDKLGDPVLIDTRNEPIPLEAPFSLDAVVVRTISMYRGLYVSAVFGANGVFVVNPWETIIVSGDKILAYARLTEKKVPVPATVIAASKEAALRAAREKGFPIILKSPIGSWGRLVSKTRSEEELRVIVEHREALPCSQQKTMIIQDYVDTGAKDIRCIVIGDELLGCIERIASKGEWRSNVALGAKTRPRSTDPELEDIALRAAEAVKGFFVSIDIFETGNGYLVNEVNATPEFKGFMRATGLNPARKLAEKIAETLHK